MGLKCRPTTIALIGIVILGQWGCAVKPIGRSAPDELRDQLGVVGVSSPRGKSAPALVTPTSGKGAAAAKGAAGGALAGAAVGGAILKGLSGCRGGGSIGAVVCGTIALVGLSVTAAGATVGALGGALHGVANAEPPSTEVSAVLKSTAAELKIENALRGGVLAAAMRQTTVAVVPTPRSSGAAHSDLRLVSETSPDTILDVALESLRLTREGPGVNPQVRLVAIARARLIGAVDGRERYRHTVMHRSDASEYYDQWALDEGRLFKQTVSAAITNMADEIVNVLLVGLPAPLPPTPTPLTSFAAPIGSTPPTTAPVRAAYDASGTYREHCRQLHLMRPDWRHYLPAYERCLAR